VARRTTEDTKELLLDVGIRLLYERGVHVGVTHIKLSDVVAAADMTTGAAYRCWENQDAFHRDLAAAAIRWRNQTPIANTVNRITQLVEAHTALAEVVRVAAEANLYRYPDDVAFLTTIALRACGPTDENLARAGRDRLETAVAAYSGMYSVLLELYQHRMRPPFTIDHLTLSLAALSEGFALQAMSGAPHPHLERPDPPPDVGSDWTLMAFAIEAIIERFTEPDPEADRGKPDRERLERARRAVAQAQLSDAQAT
jgi:AcrR family transcriptional regulator